MKTFRELTAKNESPVGKIGRTKDSEALEYIKGNHVEKEFRKIIKKLGGISVASQLLNQYKMSKRKGVAVIETKETPEKYLRASGFKIKSEEPIKDGKEIEFFKKTNAESALEDLKSAGFGKDYNLSLANTILTYKEI